MRPQRNPYIIVWMCDTAFLDVFEVELLFDLEV